MMLLYGLVRCVTVALRKLAQRRHDRAKSVYEQLQSAFNETEAMCKAEEVDLGRPLDYTGQLRLLKSFERADAARAKWLRAAHRLERRRSLEARVDGFRSARLPYSFGLIDMAFALRLFDYFGYGTAYSISGLIEAVKRWLS